VFSVAGIKFGSKSNDMKKITRLFPILAVLLVFQASAQATLEVTVKNIKEPKGNIRVGLFSSEKDFLKNAVEGKVVKATGTEITVVFEDLKAGDYGLSVIHDENENGELDSNMMGIPKEGFAFGNNAMGMFGPPDFQKAKVTVNGKPLKQIITLKYM
jgi:uncharacterized protein (DUF2141 family)